MNSRSAIAVRFPENCGVKEARKLQRELQSGFANCSPCVVVDLSQVRTIDSNGLETLLSCMEEVAKKDGTMQIDGISAEAAVLLELTRMDRLFMKFPDVSLDAPAVALATEPIADEAPAQSPMQLPVAA